jgi:hypothetical protein
MVVIRKANGLVKDLFRDFSPMSGVTLEKSLRQVRRLYVAVIECGVLHDVKVFEPVL